MTRQELCKNLEKTEKTSKTKFLLLAGTINYLFYSHSPFFLANQTSILFEMQSVRPHSSETVVLNMDGATPRSSFWICGGGGKISDCHESV